jgi:hypothetical protein
VATSSADLAIAQFMRALGNAALQLAHNLEKTTPYHPQRSIEDAGLGALQRAVAEALLNADPEAGLSPREIAKLLDRGDEPNVRSGLNRLRERGVAELVPDLPAQRWRLSPPYRKGAA